MKPDDVIRIRHMIDTAQTVRRFVTGRQRNELESDAMLLFALVRAVEIIGEAASKVSPETRSATPWVPWSAMIAMRNRLISRLFRYRPKHCLEDGNGRNPGLDAAPGFPSAYGISLAIINPCQVLAQGSTVWTRRAQASCAAVASGQAGSKSAA